MEDLQMKLYKVTVTNSTGEEWHIYANNEEEAEDNYAFGKLFREQCVLNQIEYVEEISEDDK